jgi:hypothetical protein
VKLTGFKRWIPAWYALILVLVAIYYGAIVVFYATGATGYRVKGVAFDFGRQHDGILFSIDERRAFLISDPKYVAPVTYDKVHWLLRPCGCYDSTGRTDVSDLQLGPLDGLRPEQVARQYPALWTAHESCQILLAAGYGLFAILLLIAPLAIASHRRRLRRSAHPVS